MAGCTITDLWRYNAGGGTAVARANQPIVAIPDRATRRYDDGTGTYRVLSDNPLLTSAAQKWGRTATTDGSGSFTLVLPQKGESKPTTPTAVWTIIFPDGKMLSGEVPNTSGPLTIDDLISTYSWSWVNDIQTAPATAGVQARGTAIFSAAETATVLISPSMASANYQIKLSPSVDASTLTVPAAGWSSKTTTGFTINTSGIFTGSVDWEVSL